MKGGSLQLAVREIRRQYTTLGVILALIGVGLILGISGPFGTGEVFAFLPRVAYWLVVTAGSYAIGIFLQALSWAWLGHLSQWLRILLGSLLISFGVTGFLLFFNLVIIGIIPSIGQPLIRFWLEIWAIALVVTGALDIYESRRVKPAKEVSLPRILERVPVEKRGALIALSVSDHYVHVITDRGSEMVLMRLSDAIREVGDVPGLKVHRSHWVASAHVTRAERQGDGARLTLTGGHEVPVSRSNMSAVRNAGLL